MSKWGQQSIKYPADIIVCKKKREKKIKKKNNYGYAVKQKLLLGIYFSHTVNIIGL